jgi:hypothetical protein
MNRQDANLQSSNALLLLTLDLTLLPIPNRFRTSPSLNLNISLCHHISQLCKPCVYDDFLRLEVLVGAGFDLGAVRTLVDIDFLLFDSNA